MKTSAELEKQAALMVAAARIAPKTRRIDSIHVPVTSGGSCQTRVSLQSRTTK
jgi:uncharacterized ferredoxin-like protein